VLGNVLPGLRELRAPLAAGYLWLVIFWLIWGDKVPTKSEHKAPPLDRLYGLEPIVSSFGLAVVASVTAYIVGSIAIDVQTRVGSLVADRVAGRSRRTLQLTGAGRRLLDRWAGQQEVAVRDHFRQAFIEADKARQQAYERLDDARTKAERSQSDAPQGENQGSTEDVKEAEQRLEAAHQEYARVSGEVATFVTC
jgi:DNA-binding PadR family transcriptional regulator